MRVGTSRLCQQATKGAAANGTVIRSFVGDGKRQLARINPV
jgi:hypothetical protein